MDMKVITLVPSGTHEITFLLHLCNNFALLAAGPFFFHGFSRPISRAREIENDAFHGHFTG